MFFKQWRKMDSFKCSVKSSLNKFYTDISKYFRVAFFLKPGREGVKGSGKYVLHSPTLDNHRIFEKLNKNFFTSIC